MRRRVVVTGIGVLAPGGIGAKDFWSLLTGGETATRRISFFDPAPFRSQVAAQVDFDPESHGLGPQEIRRMDRAAQFAVVTARKAVVDSGLELTALDPYRTGVIIGSAVGATMSLDAEYRVVSDNGRLGLVDHEYAVPHLYDYFVPSLFAAEVAWSVGAEGPTTVVSTGCTSGLDAVGHACELLREGSADVMIAGATDAPISPITVACFDAIKATTPRNEDPEHASRPFDRTRNGFVLGEGSAMFVLEELESAKRRNAHIYAEIAGFATRCNAFHMTGLRPDGREMAEAIWIAMNEARVRAEDIDYVNAHGSGTRQNDRHETAAFKRNLGVHAYHAPVSSIKSMIGHSLGAIGSIEIAASVLAIENNVVPPTANLHSPHPECDLDYVALTAREWHTDTVLTVGSGFGGFQRRWCWPVLRRALYDRAGGSHGFRRRSFPPSVHVEYLERGEDKERIQIWATANGEAKTWMSRRVLDSRALRVEFRQEVSQPPVGAMGGTWVIEPISDDESLVRLLHDYRAVDGDPKKLDWIDKAVDRNSRAELAALKTNAELAPRASESLLTFDNIVQINGSTKDVYDFINEAQLWSERLPHVVRVFLREDTQGLQFLEMDTRTKDGSVHTTKSVRVAFPHTKIVYKQVQVPALMTLHTGHWLLEENAEGVAVTSRHTVVINEANVAKILGDETSIDDARNYVRTVLSANSLTTLGHAKEYAEARR